MMIDGYALKKALDRLDRYQRTGDDDSLGCRDHPGMARRKHGKWVLFEDVKTAICQAIADAERNENCQK